MEAFLNYKIYPDLKLVLEVYKGEIFIEDLLNLKKQLLNDPEYSNEFDVLSDIRNADLQFQMDEIEKIHAFYNEHPERVGKRRVAILTATALQAGLAALLHHTNRTPQIARDTFSVMGSALSWIGCKTESLKIEELLQSLDVRLTN